MIFCRSGSEGGPEWVGSTLQVRVSAPDLIVHADALACLHTLA